jgi:hypothetical protein
MLIFFVGMENGANEKQEYKELVIPLKYEGPSIYQDIPRGRYRNNSLLLSSSLLNLIKNKSTAVKFIE